MLNAGLVLRALAKSDIDLLFQWRNLDQIISLSSTRRAVTWPEHSAWFSGIHNNNRIISYIIEFEELPVGRRFTGRYYHLFDPWILRARNWKLLNITSMQQIEAVP